MINLKKIFALMLVCIMIVSLAACGKGDNAVTTLPAGMEGETVPPMQIPDIDRGEEKINVVAPDNYDGVAYYRISIDRSYAYNIEIDGITSASAAEKLKNGEADVAVVSLEDAARLASEGGVKILAVNSVAKISLVENGDTIKNINDLSGKTVYCGADDVATQAIVKAIFADNGVSANFVFSSVEEIEAKMKSGEASIGIFAEPDATRIAKENEGFAKKADLTAGWEKDYAPVKSCIVADAAYAEANSDKIKEFLDHAEMGINYIAGEAGTGATALELANAGYITDAELARDMITACGFVYLDGEEMQTAITGYCGFLARNGVEITTPQF